MLYAKKRRGRSIGDKCGMPASDASPSTALGGQLHVVFRLDIDALPRAAAALAKAQVRRISASETSVLERRKGLKKLRALISLAATVDTAKAARRCDRMLRDLGRNLSQARDTDALRDTLDQLVETGVIKARGLQRRLEEALDEPADVSVQPAFDTTLARHAIVKLDFRRVRLKSVVAALAQSYGNARAGYKSGHQKSSQRRPTSGRLSEALHDWRKTVQRHARHLQLLVGLWPAEIEMRLGETKALARMLGEHHDLHLFAVWLASLDVPARNRTERAALLTSIDRRQRQLHTLSLALGAKVFAERTRHFHRRLAVYAATHA